MWNINALNVQFLHQDSLQKTFRLLDIIEIVDIA